MAQRSLQEEVEARFLPEVKDLGFSIVEHRDSGVFDNAMVVLKSPDLRVRIVRERGQVFIDVAAEPDEEPWYDLDLFMRVLGKTRHDHFALPATPESLAEFGRVISGLKKQLVVLFDRSVYLKTKRQLENEKEQRAKERFGA